MTKLLLISACAVGLTASQLANADPIAITAGNPGNQGTDNVLFNDSSLLHDGTLVQGNFTGSGQGYIIDFTSASGNNQIQGSGGQATVEGLSGNDPFTSLTFGLEDGATFTKAILNADVTGKTDGTIVFTVNYIDTFGVFVETFPVKWNGQNFFGIQAASGVTISSVTFNSLDVAFSDANQFRLGGFTGPSGGPTIPDGGVTAAMLGLGMLGLGFIARRKA
jgi:hypothetical protein